MMSGACAWSWRRSSQMNGTTDCFVLPARRRVSKRVLWSRPVREYAGDGGVGECGAAVGGNDLRWRRGAASSTMIGCREKVGFDSEGMCAGRSGDRQWDYVLNGAALLSLSLCDSRAGDDDVGSEPHLRLRVRLVVGRGTGGGPAPELAVVRCRLLLEYVPLAQHLLFRVCPMSTSLVALRITLVAVVAGTGELTRRLCGTARCPCRLQGRCPTGDDPMTTVDETDCTGKLAPGGVGTGQTGNKCHVDCSNRGKCDYVTGTCACFSGFYGSNCGSLSPVV